MATIAADTYDDYLSGHDPAALTLRDPLVSIEGADGVVFPPTFAAGDGFKGGYNIDEFADGENVCLIDSVGSQANRMEPIFMEPPYAELVPQITVTAGEDHAINLLEAGHRAGDALVRCSELQEELKAAFQSLLRGDATPLAKIAPTSLVFGVWDSRDTQAKLPRLVSSTIRAFNVKPLTRGAVYIPPVDYSSLDVFSDAEKQKAEGNAKSPLAQRGFVHNPASASHGGVLAVGGIRRDATLSLAALRMLHADTPDATESLRRYILGLALTAFTVRTTSYLRQGCNLVGDPDSPRACEAVACNGTRTPLTLTHEEALAFAQSAAEAFGVGDNKVVPFDKKKAKADVKKKE